MLKEFKEFAMKGNMLDMAVGIVLGAAFGTIIKSLVEDLIMPVVGYFSGGTDFTNKFITLGGGSFDTLEAARAAGASTVNYGLFMNALLAFIIIAFALFMIVKNVNKLKKAEEEAPAEPPAHELLLGEIRDLLKR